jgi:hypothetical protein
MQSRIRDLSVRRSDEQQEESGRESFRMSWVARKALGERCGMRRRTKGRRGERAWAESNPYERRKGGLSESEEKRADEAA